MTESRIEIRENDLEWRPEHQEIWIAVGDSKYKQLKSQILQDYEKAKSYDEIQEVFKAGNNVTWIDSKEYSKLLADSEKYNQLVQYQVEHYKQAEKDHEIVNRLNEHIEALEKEKKYHEVHNPNATVNHQITWIELGKEIRDGK